MNRWLWTVCIATCWFRKNRSAWFITEPIPKSGEIRCYIRNPDGYALATQGTMPLKKSEPREQSPASVQLEYNGLANRHTNSHVDRDPMRLLTFLLGRGGTQHARTREDAVRVAEPWLWRDTFIAIVSFNSDDSRGALLTSFSPLCSRPPEPASGEYDLPRQVIRRAAHPGRSTSPKRP